MKVSVYCHECDEVITQDDYESEIEVPVEISNFLYRQGRILESERNTLTLERLFQILSEPQK